MQMRKKAGIILILIAAACSAAIAAEDPTLDPLSLRRRLMDSIGIPPWSLARGYSMQGQFILKTTGEEISYKARYVRSSNRWAADFVQENQSRNLRYVVSGKEAWISSPEITADALPGKFPYTVQFDFPMLYDELLLILERGKRDPSFRMGGVANEISIQGKLRNGWQATFILNTVEYFPRKVLIAVAGEPSAAWLLPFAGPDGSCSLIRVPDPSSEFEIWFSDTVQAAGYRYARRMDFSENGSTVGTFILEETPAFSEIDAFFIRPSKFPWLESIQFTPRADLRRAELRGAELRESSLYLDESELSALRLRIKQSPWDRWNGENRIIACWGALMTQIGHIFPKSISLRLIFITLAVCYIGFIILLIRRRRRFQRAFSWKLLILGMFIACLVLAAGIASGQLHSSGNRSLFALHSAIRYAITGDSFFADRTDALLSDFAREAPAASIEELGSSCQAYALAYDLVRCNLPIARRLQIEEEFYNYAKPLFGASRGWISNMAAGSALSAGLGMAGLAIGYDPFVTAACETIDKTLRTQLTGGLHTSGPGPGSLAMDNAANLFYSLKHAHRADYFANTAFRQYVHATLQMISPVGVLPLFGDTDLDQSARLSAFFLKVANQLPEEEGRRCIFAHDLYWAYGRYHAEGWARGILPAFQPLMMFFDNPYVLLQYTRALQPPALGTAAPPAASVVLGNGQSAVLRAGTGPDSIYLAMNMARSNPEIAHRDILTFDLYAYRSLLLHGPGSPGRNDSRYKETASTAAGNSITMNNENQSAAECTGIESSLLNQPLFDHLRALADKTYDYGQVQRDIVMVRPETNHPAYFILLDDVFTSDPGTTVQWHLHGRGTLETGMDRASRWISTAFGPRWFKSDRVILEVSHPLGAPGDLATKTGMLYSRISLLNQESASTTIEWTGSGRFGTILLPHKSGEAQGKIEPQGKDACRIGATDWISLGSPNDHVAIGPLAHISEYVIVRDRMKTFPALLMVSGLQCQFGPHSLFCTKPVTASLNGLRGGFLNPRPNTRVEIQSPEIQAGDRFRLDDEFVTAGESGILNFTLGAAGEHSFSRAPKNQ
jgi:hypothetical protein